MATALFVFICSLLDIKHSLVLVTFVFVVFNIQIFINNFRIFNKKVKSSDSAVILQGIIVYQETYLP